MTAYRALSRAQYLAFLRSGRSFVFALALPMVLVVVFGLIFGRQIAPGGQHVIDYIVPGVLSWAVATSVVYGVAYTTMHWRTNDILRLVRVAPVSMLAVTGSRLGVTVGVAVAQAVIFLGVGLLPWFGLQVSPIGLLLMLPPLLLGCLAFVGLGLLVGNVVNSAEGVTALANCIVLPMAYLSGAFIPSYDWPPWLRGVSDALPLKHMDSAITAVLGGGRYTAGEVLVPLAALIGFTVLFGLLGLWTFRWTDES